MCRYGLSTYKPHFACFVCRKAFKRRLPQDIEGGRRDVPARCPDCGGDAADMGLDFQAPPRRDVKAWRVLADLFETGETFHSCGCGGPGYRPRDQRELARFYERQLATYRGHLAGWEAERPADERRAGIRADALAHWRERVRVLQKAIERARR